MNQKQTFLAILLSSAISLSCKTTSKTDSSFQDVGLSSTDGQVVLFYASDASNITVKQCQDRSIVKSRNDCVLKAGTIAAIVPIDDFKRHLYSVLFLSGANFTSTPSTDPTQSSSSNGTPSGVNARQAVLKSDLSFQIPQVKVLINTFATGHVANADLNSLAMGLNNLQGTLDQASLSQDDIESQSQVINQMVNHIVSEFIVSPTFTPVVQGDTDQTVMFNILKTYVANPNLTVNFKRMPSGSFTFENRNDDTNKKISISRDYDIAVNSTTQADWFAVMGNNPSNPQKSDCPSEFMQIGPVSICPSRPVTELTHHMVMTFLQKLNASSKQKFRLPTHGEWHYAYQQNYFGRIDPNRPDPHYLGEGNWLADWASNTPLATGVDQGYTMNSLGLDGGYIVPEIVDPEGPPSGDSRLVVFASNNDKTMAGTNAAINIASFGQKPNVTYAGFRLVREVVEPNPNEVARAYCFYSFKSSSNAFVTFQKSAQGIPPVRGTNDPVTGINFNDYQSTMDRAYQLTVQDQSNNSDPAAKGASVVCSPYGYIDDQFNRFYYLNMVQCYSHSGTWACRYNPDKHEYLYGPYYGFEAYSFSLNQVLTRNFPSSGAQ